MSKNSSVISLEININNLETKARRTTLTAAQRAEIAGEIERLKQQIVSIKLADEIAAKNQPKSKLKP